MAKPKKKSVRSLVLAQWNKCAHASYTADEMAVAIRRSILSVRPVFTKLAQQGVITDHYVSAWRSTKLGKPATVWLYRG